MKPVFLFFLTACLCAVVQSRAQTTLRFAPVFAGQSLALVGEESSTPSSEGTRISLFRFYVSGISLWQGEKRVWGETKSYHLLDASQPASLTLPLLSPGGIRYNAVHFTLGIDSATNAAGAGGGDLDAIKGMYWAWHSGYINLKLEGTSPKCTTRKNLFQFHLGGFQDGALCAQNIVLPVDAAASEHRIVVDVDALLSKMDLATRATMMTPGEEAVKLSRIAATMFQNPVAP